MHSSAFRKGEEEPCETIPACGSVDKFTEWAVTHGFGLSFGAAGFLICLVLSRYAYTSTTVDRYLLVLTTLTCSLTLCTAIACAQHVQATLFVDKHLEAVHEVYD